MTTQKESGIAPLGTQALQEEGQPDAPAVGQLTHQEEGQDYKVLYEQTLTERDKLQNDLKAQRVSRLKQDERDRILTSLADEVGALRRETQALLQSRAQEDEGLGQEVGRIQYETSQSRQTREIQARYTEYRDRFSEALQEAGIKPDDPALAEAYDTFNLGSNPATPITAEQRVHLWATANRMVDSLAKERLKKATHAAVEAERKAKRKALNEAGALDLDTGPGASGGPQVTGDNIDELYMAGKVSDEKYRQFLRTGQI